MYYFVKYSIRKCRNSRVSQLEILLSAGPAHTSVPFLSIFLSVVFVYRERFEIFCVLCPFCVKWR